MDAFTIADESHSVQESAIADIPLFQSTIRTLRGKRKAFKVMATEVIVKCHATFHEHFFSAVILKNFYNTKIAPCEKFSFSQGAKYIMPLSSS